MARALFWLRATIGSTGFVVAVIWYVASLLLPATKASRRQWFARAMSYLCLRPVGIRLRVRGGEHVPTASRCVFVCNHQSQLDYPIGGRVFPGNCLVVASQIGNWPLMGPIYRTSGCIEVDKDVPYRAGRTLETCAREITEGGHSIWFFVEGTRSHAPGKLGRFRRGAFRLAVRTGVPVVPVVISALKPETDLRGRRLDPHEVTVTVLPPIAPEHHDEEELLAIVRTQMAAALARQE